MPPRKSELFWRGFEGKQKGKQAFVGRSLKKRQATHPWAVFFLLFYNEDTGHATHSGPFARARFLTTERWAAETAPWNQLRAAGLDRPRSSTCGSTTWGRPCFTGPHKMAQQFSIWFSFKTHKRSRLPGQPYCFAILSHIHTSKGITWGPMLWDDSKFSFSAPCWFFSNQHNVIPLAGVQSRLPTTSVAPREPVRCNRFPADPSTPGSYFRVRVSQSAFPNSIIL